MRMNFQTAYPEADTMLDGPKKKVTVQAPKRIYARPVKEPDYDALQKKAMTEFSKTLAYLAK